MLRRSYIAVLAEPPAELVQYPEQIAVQSRLRFRSYVFRHPKPCLSHSATNCADGISVAPNGHGPPDEIFVALCLQGTDQRRGNRALARHVEFVSGEPVALKVISKPTLGLASDRTG